MELKAVTEMYEHLNNDIAALKHMPSRKKIIISVPNFNSDTHKRYFDSIVDVRNHYNKIMKIMYSKVISIEKAKFFIIYGTRL